MFVYGNLLMASDVLLILTGATMYWFSPKLKRNWILGYGSPRSMINDVTWQAANRFAGMMTAVLSLLVMSIHVSLWQVINEHEHAQILSVISLLSLPFVVMFLTEKYLSRIFRN